jgi:hypothetical protein
VSLLITEFHDVQSLGYLWVQHQVKSGGAWELDIEDSEIGSEMVSVSSTLIVYNRIEHRKQHEVNNTLHRQC